MKLYVHEPGYHQLAKLDDGGGGGGGGGGEGDH